MEEEGKGEEPKETPTENLVEEEEVAEAPSPETPEEEEPTIATDNESKQDVSLPYIATNTFEILYIQFLNANLEDAEAIRKWDIITQELVPVFLGGWEKFKDTVFHFPSPQVEYPETIFRKRLSERLRIIDTHYLTKILFKFFHIHYKLQSLKGVEKFFWKEKLYYLKCISYIARKRMPNTIRPCEKPFLELAEVLKEKRIENVVIEMMKKHIDNFNSQNQVGDSQLPIQDRGLRKETLFGQYLQELCEMLDTLIVLFYSYIPHDMEVAIDVLSILHKINFGYIYFGKRAKFLQGQIRRKILRVINLSVILMLQLFDFSKSNGINYFPPDYKELNRENATEKERLDYSMKRKRARNNFQKWSKVLLKMFDKIKRKSSQHVGALLYAWSIFMKQNRRTLYNLEKPKKIIAVFIRRGIEMGCFDFLMDMFDRSNTESYPFFGNEENVEIYKDIVRGMQEKMLDDTVINQMEYKFTEYSVGIIAGLLSEPKRYVENRKKERYFKNKFLKNCVDDQKIYLQVFKFFRKLLPLRYKTLDLFCRFCFDVHSTRFFYSLLDVQFFYTCLLDEKTIETILKEKVDFAAIEKHTIIDEQGHKIKQRKKFITQSDHTIPNRGILIKKGREMEILPSNYLIEREKLLSKKERKWVVSFKIKFAFWKVMLFDLETVKSLKSISPEKKELIRIILKFIGRIFRYGMTEMIKCLDYYYADILNKRNKVRENAPGHFVIQKLIGIMHISFKRKYYQLVEEISNIIREYCVLERNRGETVKISKYFETIMRGKEYTNLILSECNNGSYKCVLSLLPVIKTFFVYTPPKYSTDENDLSINFSVNDEFFIEWVATQIFVPHLMWRYEDLEHKWSISNYCLQIFLEWLLACTDKNLEEAINLFYEKDSLCFLSLCRILIENKELHSIISKDEIGDELDLIEQLTHTCLKLLLFLLKYRNNKVSYDQMLHFEKVFTKRLCESDNNVVSVLFDYSKDKFPGKLRIYAMKVLIEIVKLPIPPPVVSCLGNSTLIVIRRCLNYVGRSYEVNEFKVKLLQFISKLFRTQPGLFRLFVTYNNRSISPETGEDGVEDGRSVTEIEKGKDTYVKSFLQSQYMFDLHDSLDEIPTSSVMDLVTKKFLMKFRKFSWKMIFYSLKIVQPVFTTSDYKDVQTVLRNDISFWNNLFKILRSVRYSYSDDEDDDSDDDSDLSDDESFQERLGKLGIREKTKERIYLLKSAQVIFEIITIDMYYGKLFKPDDATERRKYDGKIYNAMKFPENRGVFKAAVVETTKSVKRALSSGKRMFQYQISDIREYKKNIDENFNMSRFICDVRTEYSNVFNISLLERWTFSDIMLLNNSGRDVSDFRTELLFSVDRINDQFKLFDAYLSVLTSLKPFVRVFNLPYVDVSGRMEIRSFSHLDDYLRALCKGCCPIKTFDENEGISRRSMLPENLKEIQLKYNLKCSVLLVYFIKALSQKSKKEYNKISWKFEKEMQGSQTKNISDKKKREFFEKRKKFVQRVLAKMDPVFTNDMLKNLIVGLKNYISDIPPNYKTATSEDNTNLEEEFLVTSILENILVLFTKCFLYKLDSHRSTSLYPVLFLVLKKLPPESTACIISLSLLSRMCLEFDRKVDDTIPRGIVENICTLTKDKSIKEVDFLINIMSLLLSFSVVNEEKTAEIVFSQGVLTTVFDVIENLTTKNGKGIPKVVYNKVKIKKNKKIIDIHQIKKEELEKGDEIQEYVQSPWHRLWILTLKVITSFEIRSKDHYFEEFLDRGRNRIFFCLSQEFWEKKDLSLKELEESVLVSTLLLKLTNEGITMKEYNKMYIQRICSGFSFCVDNLRKRFKQIDIQPITKSEKKDFHESSFLVDIDMKYLTGVCHRNHHFFEKKHRKLSWNTNIFLNVFQTVRSLMTSITVIVQKSFEKKINNPIHGFNVGRYFVFLSKYCKEITALLSNIESELHPIIFHNLEQYRDLWEDYAEEEKRKFIVYNYQKKTNDIQILFGISGKMSREANTSVKLFQHIVGKIKTQTGRKNEVFCNSYCQMYEEIRRNFESQYVS